MSWVIKHKKLYLDRSTQMLRKEYDYQSSPTLNMWMSVISWLELSIFILLYSSKNIFLTPPWKGNLVILWGWESQMPIKAFEGNYENKPGISRGEGRRDSNLINAFCERDHYFLEHCSIARWWCFLIYFLKSIFNC